MIIIENTKPKHYKSEHLSFFIQRCVRKIFPLTRYIDLFYLYHKKIRSKLDPYFFQALNTFDESSEEVDAVDGDKVWFYWSQGVDNAPEVVKLCYLNNLKLFGKNLVLITEQNLKQYLKLPDYILNKVDEGTISKTHFSDIIRMGLLGKYGGLWIDATVLASVPIDLSLEIITGCNNRTDKFNVSGGRWTGFFFGGKQVQKVARFIFKSFCMYWAENDTLIDYFFIDYAIEFAFRHNVGMFRELNTRAPRYKVSLDPEDLNKVGKSKLQTSEIFKLTYKKPVNIEAIKNIINNSH